MKIKFSFPLFIISALILSLSGFFIIRGSDYWKIGSRIAEYAGTESCRPCHENFYQLWAPSQHGLAMQPVDKNFLELNIPFSDTIIKVANAEFSIIVKDNSLLFTETMPSGEMNTYRAIHTMGGKYVYYFLTEFDRGRLHVLPLAYDCKEKLWYNNPESGVRHFEEIEDSALEWKSHFYTFNTSCYSCHVSQLESNYKLETLEYSTTWNEPGINCETCHGPSSEHIRVCVKAGEGNVPEDLKIIRTSQFSQAQHNSSCGSCHAKSAVIATSFLAGEEFYDYFDLITIENLDFYPDGRDLGENYTMTSWAMNKCNLSGQLSCTSCHTSSGRYIFADENPNNACAPCHNDKINSNAAHTVHKASGKGSICISCHMPMTTFARMDRSDHSFRPPMPEATIAFGSPNACNICHIDKSPEWANNEIKKTHKREYQNQTIARGELIREARSGNWENLDMILEGLNNNSFDQVFACSFIRLLENCNNEKKWDAILAKTLDSSPLVRSAAAHALYGNNDKESYKVLNKLLSDDYRLVRLNAAYAISYYPEAVSNIDVDPLISDALIEYKNSLIARPDDWSAHYNLGNFYNNLGDYKNALLSYNNSIRVFPEAIMSMVNAGFLYSVSGNSEKAEEMFELALSYSPDHEAALLNLALLYGETGQQARSIAYFKRLMNVSDKNAVAAFNLSILLSDEDAAESLRLIRSASDWDSENIRYAYTYAYFLARNEMYIKSENKLKEILLANPDNYDALILLSDVFIKNDKVEDARILLSKGIDNVYFSQEQKLSIQNILKSIQ